ncbi:38k [Sucra jujuba nucleopolyhedrovirus]|uniref:38k n=1 Tax=Sucra jujuba nucleopolyhedrovirus TaxID=1563660 RepID=A0A097P912_9ABAC|nr:38k [Sucra jujuba nucleopolyhedrovirus]AIU41320.1 38k [Sucra jujuba nucleopolyhedrovirus]
MQCLEAVTFTILRLKRPVLRRHLLVVNRYDDLRRLFFGHWEMFEFVIFAFDKQCTAINSDNYIIQIIECQDNMKSIRQNLKLAYKTSFLGHTYVINECVPMYQFLKEWYVLNYLEIYQIKPDLLWNIPHVVVFDLDSTLITDELTVRIRDEMVYQSLDELKQKGCVLVLWSYGNEKHVVESLKETDLIDYFDITICKGYRIGSNSKKSIVVDNKNDLLFVQRPFYTDVQEYDTTTLPKSPRIVLWHLRKFGVNYVKSLTLVDDLKTNDYNYDYFVNVKKCPEPRNDWQHYHEMIVDNMDLHDLQFV